MSLESPQLHHLRARTYSPRVLAAGPGGAGTFFRLDFNEKLFARNYRDPILVGAAAGFPDKVRLALQLQRPDVLGADLVANAVNDLLAHAAEPLFFQHHLALSTRDSPALPELARGISDGCLQAGCALLGGQEIGGASDTSLAGFAIGVIEKKKILQPRSIQPGDSVLGVASDGLHAAGFPLVREILGRISPPLFDLLPEINASLPDEFLRPTRFYAHPIRRLLARYKVKRIIKAMTHVNEGGLAAALPRMVPDGFALRLKRDSWTLPPVFHWLQAHSPIPPDELPNHFNMGIGFALIVRPAFTKPIMSHLRTLGEKPFFLGKVKKGDTPKLEWA